MKQLLFSFSLALVLAGCVTAPPNEAVQATQAMTDMDGKPIDPGHTGAFGSNVGIGIGIGKWGGRSGGGVGIGVGF